jgi:hypothetical protein
MPLKEENHLLSQLSVSHCATLAFKSRILFIHDGKCNILMKRLPNLSKMKIYIMGIESSTLCMLGKSSNTELHA